MTDKAREAFEVWFESSYGFCLSKDDETTYSTPWVNDMFHAWKASRAALVVELPSDWRGGDFADGYNSAICAIENSLDDAGVSYK